LIYLNRSAQSVRELTYTKTDSKGTSKYRVVSTTFKNHQFSSWAYFDSEKTEPQKLIPVERRKNILIINNELFEFNKAGFCKDGEDKDGQYQMCISSILPQYKINDNITTDSVFIFSKEYKDSRLVELLISAGDNVIVAKKSTKGNEMSTELLTDILEK